MATVIQTEGKSTEGKPRRRRKRGSDRWLSEVKGIAALLAAGFGLIALTTFDPTLTPAEQQGLTGPVGVWLGWATFQSFGYAGFLLPLLLGAWGASAFLRPIVVRGWVPLAGLGTLLIAAAGLLTQATRVRSGAVGGGLVGYATTGVLHAGFGDVGTWLMLVAAIPIGVLCVTRVSYAAVVRITTSRLTRLKRRRAQSAPAVRVAAELLPAVEPQAAEALALPVVVEPSRPRGRLAEQGLAWQETFDFGRGGAATFQLPPVGLLKVPPASELKRTREELQDNAETIRRKLQDFEVEGRIVQVSPGPIITSYEFEPAAGVKISQVVNLGDDLALALKSASVRIVGPIPGRGTVAIEVPNSEAATVYLREIFVSAEFAESKGKLPLALGKDVTGTPVVSDLTSMPHLLVAGATGSGKSVGLNSMICSILYKATPADVRFLLIDPKRLELSVYEGIPHLLAPVVTDAKEAAARLRWIVGKMDERYRTLQIKQVRNIEGYNKVVAPEERLPYWVVVVDELADLMMVSAGEVQTSLVRLAQIARGRNPSDHRDPAPLRRRRDRLDQGELPDAHRIPGGVEGRLEDRARRQRRRAAARPRRHDFRPTRRQQADARARRLGRRRRGARDLRFPAQAGHRGLRGGRAGDRGRSGRRGRRRPRRPLLGRRAPRDRAAPGLDLVPAAAHAPGLSEGRALHRHDGAGSSHRSR